MDTRQIRTLEDPSSAPPAELEAALIHLDELDASSLARLDAHPEQGLRLRVLRAAESWLSENAPVERAEAGPCPPAEALYEFGGGPGVLMPASQASMARDASIAHHLESCAQCAALVASLEGTPPLPLEWTRIADEFEDGEDELEGSAPRTLPDRHDGREASPAAAEPPSSTTSPPPLEPVTAVSPWFARWYPLAAAAALLMGVFVAPRFMSGSNLSGLPSPQILRGSESAALYFPRGPVLADAEGSAAPFFELAAVDGASEYRVELFLHGSAGGEVEAFEQGQRVADLRSIAPSFVVTPLAAGRYTWRAYVTVNQLERSLGALEFEIRSDERFAGLQAATVSDELAAQVTALHHAGYLTDARALARRLPESPAREEYLLPPGR